MTEPDNDNEPVRTDGFILLSPLGHVVVERNRDGDRVVAHADPTIRVADNLTDLIENGTVDMDWLSHDGHVQLDTDGRYLYRSTPTVEGAWRLHVLIGGADDPAAPGYEPHP